MEAGLVSGKMLLTDSTHVRANARNDCSEVIEVPDTPSEYMKKLDKEALEIGLIKEPVKYDSNKTKLVIKSTTDHECGILNRPGKPKGFYYLSHQTCDAENGIITDVIVTPANVNDCTVHTARLEKQIDKFGFKTESICADAGYDNSEVYDAMLKRGIKTYIPKKSKPSEKANYTDDFRPEKFAYDSAGNFYICPVGKELHYSCYNKKNRVKRYRAKKRDCLNCPLKQQCIGKSNHPRQIERNMHEEARQIQVKNINTPEYKIAMNLRRIWCEGNFAHQKELHNLSRTRKRGIKNLTEQCLLSACALNLKRLVKYLKEHLFHPIKLKFFAVQLFLNSFFHVFCYFCQQLLND